MKKYPVSVQLYSVREIVNNNFPDILTRISKMGYAGFEFAGYHGLEPKQVRTIIDELGVKASSCHGPIPTKETINRIADEARTLGFTYYFASLNPNQCSTEEDVKKSVDVVAETCELTAKSGIRFGLHNHWWDFDKTFNGKTPWETVMDNVPSLIAQIDTYWVKVAGVDPVDIIRKYVKRIPLLHIKDGPLVKGEPMTAVGDGLMKWKPIIDAADPSVLEWIVVEIDKCSTDMMEAVGKSVKYLVDSGYGIVR